MIRIPAARGKKTRTEVRSVDVAANPYLALAAILRAGLDGIDGNCKAVPPIYDNLFKCTDAEREALGVGELPANLFEAMKAFKHDPLIQEAMGPHITEKLLEAKRREWNEFRRHVSEWEIKRYINRY
jgi:glutamine synthetase